MRKFVTTLNLDEIKDKYKERYGDEWFFAFTNTDTENDNALCDYDKDDEFYTDGTKYIAVDEVGEIIDRRDAWLWIIETDGEQDMYDYFKDAFEKAIRCCVGFELTTDEVAEGYRNVAIENADNFLEWKWGGKNNDN